MTRVPTNGATTPEHSCYGCNMNDQQLLRYSRHIMLPQIDVAGQQHLLDAHVAIIGLGGLGSPAAMYLAASGIGKLTLVDFDRVETGNLQRQIIHREQQVGINKAQSAADTLQQLNADTVIDCIESRLDETGLGTLACGVDVVLDATDNFDTRYRINRACLLANTPLVSGAAIRFEGQLTVFDFRQPTSACYACIYGDDAGEQEPTCSENGILAPVVGMIGCGMAIETIKLLCRLGKPASHRLLMLDALDMQWREMRYAKDPSCPVCSANNRQ